jgi:hypothetical protein
MAIRKIATVDMSIGQKTDNSTNERSVFPRACGQSSSPEWQAKSIVGKSFLCLPIIIDIKGMYQVALLIVH